MVLFSSTAMKQYLDHRTSIKPAIFAPPTGTDTPIYLPAGERWVVAALLSVRLQLSHHHVTDFIFQCFSCIDEKIFGDQMIFADDVCLWLRAFDLALELIGFWMTGLRNILSPIHLFFVLSMLGLEFVRGNRSANAKRITSLRKMTDVGYDSLLILVCGRIGSSRKTHK
jgi:hypothetical protein